MAETSGLLNRRRGITPTEGSNPSVSAILLRPWGFAGLALPGAKQEEGISEQRPKGIAAEKIGLAPRPTPEDESPQAAIGQASS